MSPKIILGLDISTKCCGYSIIDASTSPPTLIHCSFIKPPQKGSIFDRITKTQVEIEKLLHQYSPDCVGIEQIASYFGKFSTAQTIIALARINIAVGLTCYEYLGHEPAMFNVMQIRHGLKLTPALPKKEEIPQLLEKLLGIKFPYVYKNGEIAEESYDTSDSLAVAIYTAKYIQTLETELSKPLNLALPKKRLNKLKKTRKEQLLEYSQITGKKWT
jgi:Holliday junction resolvasome RuvABC endonuclease subunit